MPQWIRIEIGRPSRSPLEAAGRFLRALVGMAFGLIVLILMLPLILFAILAGLIFGWRIRRAARRFYGRVWNIHAGRSEARTHGRPRKHVDSVAYEAGPDEGE